MPGAPWKRTVALLFVAVIVAWAVIAARLDLFGDQAFYWLCAQHPAPT